ncbi:MAG: sensor histidine kinase [Solirubrobacteraceae bacterium]
MWTPEQWLPRSLRWRLAAWVAVVMVVATAILFVVVYVQTGSEISGQIDHDIAGDTSQMREALRPLAGRGAVRIAQRADAYVRAQPYSADSTLLFVIVPGAPTASNHLEVFGGGAPEGTEGLAEQARENAVGQRLLRPRLGYSTQFVPDVGPVRLRERAVPLGSLTAVVAAGDPLSIIENAQHGVARTFVLAGAVSIAIALLSSYLAGARVTAPLRRMAGVAARVDAGDLEPRMDASPAGASEVQVLAEGFNHMLDRLSEAFAGQRAFVADASHELRTPLTVIRGQLEVLAAQERPPAEEVRRVEQLVQSEITRISRLVDDLLLLAQAEQTNFLRSEDIELSPFVVDLWDGLSLTAKRRFELGQIPDGTLSADPDRLAQALRNLARNAVEHTADPTGLVRLEVRHTTLDRVRFTVTDDGPGIPSPERDRVFERFHRTDGSRARIAGGAGLGLAIVRAIAEAHGGSVRVAESVSGRGARIELTLGGFRPRRR